jgi:hypothetical protein
MSAVDLKTHLGLAEESDVAALRGMSIPTFRNPLNRHSLYARRCVESRSQCCRPEHRNTVQKTIDVYKALISRAISALYKNVRAFTIPAVV